MKKTIIPLFGLLALSFSINSQAEIYKWTDANGQVHYSARPPVQKKVKAKEIESDIRMSAGKFDPSSVKKEKTETNSEEKEEKTEKDKDTKSKPTKQLIDFCKNQRKNLDLLKKNQNIVWEQFGKKTSLTANQRKAKMNKIKSTITEECKGI